MLELLQPYPAPMIVYNQHADAIKLVDHLQLSADQVFFEIRQDTLELNYQ